METTAKTQNNNQQYKTLYISNNLL